MERSRGRAEPRQEPEDALLQSQRVALRRHEQWLLADPLRERAVLLDAAGRAITRKEDEPSHVLWTEAALRPLYGKVDLITHNHPGGSSIGEDDLATALFLNAREVNAITPQLRFRLARKADAWPDTLLDVFTDEQTRLVREMGTALNDGRMTEEQVELLFYHELWQRVARQFPDRLLYEMERRR